MHAVVWVCSCGKRGVGCVCMWDVCVYVGCVCMWDVCTQRQVGVYNNDDYCYLVGTIVLFLPFSQPIQPPKTPTQPPYGYIPVGLAVQLPLLLASSAARRHQHLPRQLLHDPTVPVMVCV